MVIVDDGLLGREGEGEREMVDVMEEKKEL